MLKVNIKEWVNLVLYVNMRQLHQVIRIGMLKVNMKEWCIPAQNVIILQLQQLTWRDILKASIKKWDILVCNVNMRQLQQAVWRNMLKVNTKELDILSLSMWVYCNYSMWTETVKVVIRIFKLKINMQEWDILANNVTILQLKQGI